MRYGLTISALASLLLLGGCNHKKPVAAPPPQAQAPVVKPLPPPAQPQPALKLPKPPPPTLVPETKPAEPVHHHKLKPSPTTPDTTPPVVPPTQQTASIPAPASASAIGQLSEGGSSASGDVRNQTVDLIASVEHKLKGISRPLSAPEQKTAAQVRKFLQEASDALHSQDVDAAHTLATKADVLLEELLK
jgi:outer membrane biosynthesis protein TonB